MNPARRKAIDEAISTIEGLSGKIEELAAEEREYFDNMAESLQGSEKGEMASAAAEALESAHSQLDEVRASLEEAKG